MSIITGQDLSLGYEGKTVIENINFEVNDGDYLGIVGENGAGKSTLMKAILSLIEPLSGQIIYGDGLTKNEIGYLPQQTSIQRDFPATVEEVVMSGFQGDMGFRPFYTKKEKEGALKNMKRMGIIDLSKACYRELSGGQQQRVLLARALCATGKVLLLDEPVTGLDPKATSELYKLIKCLNDEGVTIIMISHDIEAALKYSSHILHVDKRSFYGSKEDYLKSNLGKKFLLINEMEGKVNG